MCLYPKLIKNRKYTANKKNGGIIPAVTDERTLYVPIGCGKCMECMKKKSREWQVRLQEEIRTDKTGKFITLTFNEKSLQELEKEIQKDNKINDKIEENIIATIAVRRFLERWRKEFKKSVKHWLITELGHQGTERIHLHGLLFTNESNEKIEEKWKYGYIFVGDYVNNKTINYIIKYVTKVDKDHKGYTPIILTSSGMGKNYLKRDDAKNNKFKNENTLEYYKTIQGFKQNLPIYYRNKLYTDEEKEKLWLNKLDKQIRYVGGEKIDISKGEETYYKTLEYYQIRNKQLGYGDDTTDWSKETYKQQRDKIKTLGRLAKETDKKG